MTNEDFQQYLAKQVMYEARYKDSEGRDILVICEVDALGMVSDLVRAEREACAKIVYGMCISDNNAQEIVTAIRARGEK